MLLVSTKQSDFAKESNQNKYRCVGQPVGTNRRVGQKQVRIPQEKKNSCMRMRQNDPAHEADSYSYNDRTLMSIQVQRRKHRTEIYMPSSGVSSLPRQTHRSLIHIPELEKDRRGNDPSQGNPREKEEKSPMVEGET